MEIGGHEAPAPVRDEQPLHENQGLQEVWHPRDFQRRLTSRQEIVYQELPREIHLHDKWHALMEQLVASTTQQGREYAVTVSCIDRYGPLMSKPFAIDLFFQDQWGDSDAPMFISHVSVGSESHAEPCITPSAIEWKGEVVPLWRVGGVHTHPDDVPFSDGDMLWLTNPDTRKKFEAVATKSHTYLLIRSDAELYGAHQFIQKRENRFSWPQWTRYQLQPRRAILHRNQEMARFYKFGLFQGKPGDPLIRLA